MNKAKKLGFLKINVVLQHIIEHLVKTLDWVCFVLNFHSLFELVEVETILCRVHFYLHKHVLELKETFLRRCFQY